MVTIPFFVFKSLPFLPTRAHTDIGRGRSDSTRRAILHERRRVHSSHAQLHPSSKIQSRAPTVFTSEPKPKSIPNKRQSRSSEEPASGYQGKISRALENYIDRTGSLPKATRLEEFIIRSNGASGLRRSLVNQGYSEQQFLDWRDFLSVSDLGDGLKRMGWWGGEFVNGNKGQERGERVEVDNIHPAWVLELLLRKQVNTPEAGLQGIKLACRLLPYYNPEDKLSVLGRCVYIACGQRFYSTIVALVDELVLVLSQQSRSEVSPSITKGRLSSPIRSLSWLLDRLTTEGGRDRSENALIRQQLFRLASRSELNDMQKVSANSLNRLFQPHRLDTGMLPDLGDHLSTHSIDLKSQWARNSFLAASWEGRLDLAEQFLKTMVNQEGVIGEKVEGATIHLMGKKKQLYRLVQKARNETKWESSKPEDIGKGSDERKRPGERSSALWSTILSVASRMSSVSMHEWENLVSRLPPKECSVVTVSSIMYGYVGRGNPELALEHWQRMLEDGIRPDAVALSIAAQAEIASNRLEEAIRMVDSWAAKAESTEAEGKITLDAQTVNILLEGCSRHSRPDIAYELWKGMAPRWGVLPDSVSLATIVSCGDYASRDGSTWGNRIRSKQSLWSNFVTEFKNGFGHKDMLNDASDPCDPEEGSFRDSIYKTGSIDVIIGAPGDDSSRPVVDSDSARELFERILYDNFPSDGWMAPLSNTFVDTPLWKRIPSNSRYATLFPSPSAFHAYITLLGHRNMSNKILTALTHMRRLGIIPQRRTLLRAMMYIDRDTTPLAESAKSWQKATGKLAGFSLGTKEEALREWLKDWLGEEMIATEDDLAKFTHGQLQGRATRAKQSDS